MQVIISFLSNVCLLSSSYGFNGSRLFRSGSFPSPLSAFQINFQSEEVGVKLFSENILYNRTLESLYRYMDDFHDDVSKQWLENYLSDYSGSLKWGNFLESLILNKAMVVPYQKSAPKYYFGAKSRVGDGKRVGGSRLVEPRGLAYRLISIKDDIIRGTRLKASAI